MKKTYKNPTLTVVKIQAAHILAGSEVGKGGSYGGGTIQARGGRFSDWDEDLDN